MEKPLFQKVAIVGVGLLGASIGMGLKKRKIAKHVCGFFRHEGKIKKALLKEAVDEGTNNLALAVQNADLVILCSPVDDIVALLKKLKSLKCRALITDVGSTKKEILRAASGLRFVGSHPLAGSEHSGIDFAQAGLFEKTLCILTTDQTQKSSLDKIASLWKKLGAKSVTMTAEHHDKAVSFTSHLPHAVAYALMTAVPENLACLAAGGLKDTTRIASSNPDLWSGIFLSNRKEVLKSLSVFEKSVARLKKAIAGNRKNDLVRFLSLARDKRNSCLPLSK